MTGRNLRNSAIALAAATPLYALADSLNAKPGACEMTTTTLATGILNR